MLAVLGEFDALLDDERATLECDCDYVALTGRKSIGRSFCLAGLDDVSRFPLLSTAGCDWMIAGLGRSSHAFSRNRGAVRRVGWLRDPAGSKSLKMPEPKWSACQKSRS